jgi:hypothetical protein
MSTVGSFTIGYHVGTVASDPSAFAIVENLETVALDGRRRRVIERHLIGVKTLPMGESYAEHVRRVAEWCAPLGPFARLVFDKTSPGGVVERLLIDARRGKQFSTGPWGILITPGEGIVPTEHGLSAGYNEVIKTLQEALRTKTLRYPARLAGVEDLVRGALGVKLDVNATTNKLTFSERDSRVFALALAVHPTFTMKRGRRFRDANGREWADFDTAAGALGALVYERFDVRPPEVVLNTSYDLPVDVTL